MHIIFIIDPNQRNRFNDYLCWREWYSDGVFGALEIKKHIREGRWACAYNREEHDQYLFNQ